MSNLVHVNKIEMVPSESIPTLKVISGTECCVSSDIQFQELCIREFVGVTVEDSYENNQKVYTTTCKFQTKDKKPLGMRRLAFRLTSIDGKRYMVGTGKRPYPVVKEQNAFPEKATDSQLKTVTITWKSLYPMLRIVE